MLPQHWLLLRTETIWSQAKREFCFSFCNIGKIKQKEDIRLTMATLNLIFLLEQTYFWRRKGNPLVKKPLKTARQKHPAFKFPMNISKADNSTQPPQPQCDSHSSQRAQTPTQKCSPLGAVV